MAENGGHGHDEFQALLSRLESLETQVDGIPVPLVVLSAVDVPLPIVLPLNTWVDLDNAHPVEAEISLDLSTVSSGRTTVRYVKVRWVTVPSGVVVATDTRTIPSDLPKSSWQSLFTTQFSPPTGETAKFQVYVGATKPGTVSSPRRNYLMEVRV
jgi:hypothetical protein